MSCISFYSKLTSPRSQPSLITTTTVRCVTMLGAKLRLKVCKERPMLVPPDQPRILPEIFSSASSRYVLKKVQPQKKNVEASTTNATNQPQPTTGNAKASEQGRKHPAEMAKTVSGPDLFASPIAFQNNSAGIRKVYWLDPNGERQLYRELKPGESYGLETYLTHPWVVTDAHGKAVGLYFPDGQKRTVTLE